MRYFFIFLLIFFSKSALALSTKDIELYKSIFHDYRNGNFKEADKNIVKLDDNILMGHVEALKLLHPTKHRSSFSELRIWLSKYNDQYESKRIYKLAIKRIPSGSQKPLKNIFILSEGEHPPKWLMQRIYNFQNNGDLKEFMSLKKPEKVE